MKKNKKYLFGIPLKQIKPAFIKLLLASVAVAGLVGIVSLLSGEFGETQSRILLTVILTSGLSVGMLIYLSVMDTRYQVLGLAGGVISVISFMLGMWLVWTEWNLFNGQYEHLIKNYAFSTIVAIAIAHT